MKAGDKSLADRTGRGLRPGRGASMARKAWILDRVSLQASTHRTSLNWLKLMRCAAQRTGVKVAPSGPRPGSSLIRPIRGAAQSELAQIKNCDLMEF